MVTASWDHTARIWDARTGKLLTEPLAHPDGARAVTASDDYTARVWDARTSKLLTEPSHIKARSTAAEFSPDGARVVTASDDKTARV